MQGRRANLPRWAEDQTPASTVSDVVHATQVTAAFLRRTESPTTTSVFLGIDLAAAHMSPPASGLAGRTDHRCGIRQQRFPVGRSLDISLRHHSDRVCALVTAGRTDYNHAGPMNLAETPVSVLHGKNRHTQMLGDFEIIRQIGRGAEWASSSRLASGR